MSFVQPRTRRDAQRVWFQPMSYVAPRSGWRVSFSRATRVPSISSTLNSKIAQGKGVAWFGKAAQALGNPAAGGGDAFGGQSFGRLIRPVHAAATRHQFARCSGRGGGGAVFPGRIHPESGRPIPPGCFPGWPGRRCRPIRPRRWRDGVFAREKAGGVFPGGWFRGRKSICGRRRANPAALPALARKAKRSLQWTTPRVLSKLPSSQSGKRE